MCSDSRLEPTAGAVLNDVVGIAAQLGERGSEGLGFQAVEVEADPLGGGLRIGGTNPSFVDQFAVQLTLDEAVTCVGVRFELRGECLERGS